MFETKIPGNLDISYSLTIYRNKGDSGINTIKQGDVGTRTNAWTLMAKRSL